MKKSLYFKNIKFEPKVDSQCKTLWYIMEILYSNVRSDKMYILNHTYLSNPRKFYIK